MLFSETHPDEDDIEGDQWHQKSCAKQTTSKSLQWMHRPVNYRRNWPFLNGSTSINLPTTSTIIPSTKNLSSNTLCAIGTLQRGNQVLYLRRVPSVGIVVPCEGIDQRTKNAAGKACHWALTHRIMLEHHTWRTHGIRSAGHFVEVFSGFFLWTVDAIHHARG